MKELIAFLSYIRSSDSKILQQRLVAVCNLVGEMFLSNGLGKSWFWKLRHLVYRLEEYFTKDMNRSELIKTFNLYIAMQDYHHAEEWLNKFATKIDYAKGHVVLLISQRK